MQCKGPPSAKEDRIPCIGTTQRTKELQLEVLITAEDSAPLVYHICTVALVANLGGYCSFDSAPGMSQY